MKKLQQKQTQNQLNKQNPTAEAKHSSLPANQTCRIQQQYAESSRSKNPAAAAAKLVETRGICRIQQQQQNHNNKQVSQTIQQQQQTSLLNQQTDMPNMQPASAAISHSNRQHDK